LPAVAPFAPPPATVRTAPDADTLRIALFEESLM
jgi:hypothetical protein